MKKFIRCVLNLMGVFFVLALLTTGFYIGTYVGGWIFLYLTTQGLSFLLLSKIAGGVFFVILFLNLFQGILKAYNNKGE